MSTLTKYVTHRAVREDVPPSSENPLEQTAMKFYPIREPDGSVFWFYDYSPEEAFEHAIELFPYLRLFLAVEPLKTFEESQRRFAQLKTENGYTPRNKTFSPNRSKRPREA